MASSRLPGASATQGQAGTRTAIATGRAGQQPQSAPVPSDAVAPARPASSVLLQHDSEPRVSAK